MSVGSRRVAVVTGASSGIGLEAATRLAEQGYDVIAVGRDPGRAAAAEQVLRAAAGGAVTMLLGDLARIKDAERLAGEIAARTDRVDLLLNNAGGMAKALRMTPEGLEENFAGNHLGPFALTRLLLPLLQHAARTAPPGSVRILNTASDAGEMIPALDLDDMQNLAQWNPGVAYCSGKLANVMFARALGTRLAGDGIVAHAYHPGAVDSNFFSHAAADTQERTKDIAKFTVEEGADTLVWLATADEPGRSTGGYFHRRAPRQPPRQVEDAAALERFWKESEKLVASART